MNANDLKAMTPRQLNAQALRLRGSERESMVDLLLVLAEMDRTGKHRMLSAPSLWAYLTEQLGIDPHEVDMIIAMRGKEDEGEVVSPHLPAPMP